MTPQEFANAIAILGTDEVKLVARSINYETADLVTLAHWIDCLGEDDAMQAEALAS